MITNHLRYFVEVTDKKSFTKAAEDLYVSQSTISKAITTLETELHTRLYEHGNRSFTLTPAGKLLYAFAVDVLNYYETREKELLLRLEDADTRLRLGLPPTAGSIYFFSLISDFKFMYPEILLSINDATSRYIPDMLLRGELDLGVVIEPFEDERFIKKAAFKSEAVLVVSDNHELFEKDEVDFSELKDEKFLQVTRDFQYRSVFEDYCNKAGFMPDVKFENNQWDMILEMVADHQGVTVLPLPLVEKYQPKHVKFIHLKNPEFPWQLTIIYPRSLSVTKTMQKFLDLV